MSSKKQNIQEIASSLVKLPILFLYTTFFTVQLFFNIGSNNYSNYTIVSSHSTKKVHTAHTIKKADKTVKATVRLNKRFQPEVTPSCNHCTIELPVYFLNTDVSALLPAPSTCSTGRFTFSLRGPPIIWS